MGEENCIHDDIYSHTNLFFLTTTTGPPTMRLERHFKVETTDQPVQISCTLCTSNPPSTITWFFNGARLDLNKNKISVISGWCEESLYFKASKNTAGNYSCMAKNDFGQAYSTTEMRVYGTAISCLFVLYLYISFY
jgi:hypothetical protein